MRPEDRREETSWWRKLWTPFSRALDGVNRFLSKRYVWVGLLLGFLWMFPAPFLIFMFLDWFQSQQNAWMIFFPLYFSLSIFELFGSLEAAESGGILAVWVTATVIGMLFGLVVGFVIHRLHMIYKRGYI